MWSHVLFQKFRRLAAIIALQTLMFRPTRMKLLVITQLLEGIVFHTAHIALQWWSQADFVRNLDVGLLSRAKIKISRRMKTNVMLTFKYRGSVYRFGHKEHWTFSILHFASAICLCWIFQKSHTSFRRRRWAKRFHLPLIEFYFWRLCDMWCIGQFLHVF